MSVMNEWWMMKLYYEKACMWACFVMFVCCLCDVYSVNAYVVQTYKDRSGAVSGRGYFGIGDVRCDI